MRVFSFAQESSRFCNYSKDKFNNEITFIIPSFLNIKEGQYDKFFIVDNKNIQLLQKQIGEDNWDFYESFMNALGQAESEYLYMIGRGYSPQQARAVLPNALKSEIVITGFAGDWDELFDKRTSIAKTGKPHPDMEAIMNPLMEEFIERGYINEKENFNSI